MGFALFIERPRSSIARAVTLSKARLHSSSWEGTQIYPHQNHDQEPRTRTEHRTRKTGYGHEQNQTFHPAAPHPEPRPRTKDRDTHRTNPELHRQNHQNAKLFTGTSHQKSEHRSTSKRTTAWVPQHCPTENSTKPRKRPKINNSRNCTLDRNFCNCNLDPN